MQMKMKLIERNISTIRQMRRIVSTVQRNEFVFDLKHEWSGSKKEQFYCLTLNHQLGSHKNVLTKFIDDS